MGAFQSYLTEFTKISGTATTPVITAVPVLGPLFGLGDRDADRLALIVTLFEQGIGDLDSP
jgi:hypothetical protein